jgi:hypothetical protein
MTRDVSKTGRVVVCIIVHAYFILQRNLIPQRYELFILAMINEKAENQEMLNGLIVEWFNC